MGLVFWLTDRASPTSRTLAPFLGLLGIAVYANALVVGRWLDTPLPHWTRIVGLVDAAVFIAGCKLGIHHAGTGSRGGRYEYMAVGPAVNLASRLCDKAADGEIHIDEPTLTGNGEPLPARRRRRDVRGIGVPVPTYVLEDATS